tara:strand:- start:2398 stop:3111 length:714 start_codon:yes stop_codon:yes gene_type:complete
MGKTILIILCFLLLIQASYAWDWQVHPRIAEKAVEALPLEIQEKLNTTKLIEGSIAPDKDFHDNVLHHYPPSYNKTLYWLNITKIEFEKENYNEASYAFGVASHYITDSFATPHYIYKEPGWLHSKYEKQPNEFEIQTTCKNKHLDLKDKLEYESTKTNLWSSWLETYDHSIPQNQVELATELMYSVALETFDTKCSPLTLTTESKTPRLPTTPIAIALMVSLTSIIITRKLKPFKH